MCVLPAAAVGQVVCVLPAAAVGQVVCVLPAAAVGQVVCVLPAAAVGQVVCVLPAAAVGQVVWVLPAAAVGQVVEVRLLSVFPESWIQSHVVYRMQIGGTVPTAFPVIEQWLVSVKWHLSLWSFGKESETNIWMNK